MKLPPEETTKADLRHVLEVVHEDADEGIVEALDCHIRLVARWNARYHLTSIEKWAEILDRHVCESLLPLRWIPRDAVGPLLDVGSGNGFPAIPLLVCRTRMRGVLAERSEKKALFLEAAVRECGLGGGASPEGDAPSSLGVPCGSAGQRDARGHLGRMASLDSEGLVSGASTSRVTIRTGDLAVRNSRSDGGRLPSRRGRSGRVARGSPDVAGLFDFVTSRATLAPGPYLDLAESWTGPGGLIFMYAAREDGDAAVGTHPGLRLIERQEIPHRTDSHLFVLQR